MSTASRVAPTFSRPPPDATERAWDEHFQRTAGVLPRHPVASYMLRDDLVSALRRMIPAEGRVLHVGCEGGDLLAALSGRDRLGIDLDEGLIARARATFPHVRFNVADGKQFRTHERFDAIVCDRLVHSVADVQSLLTNLAGLLAPTGRLYLGCFNYLWEPIAKLGERLGFKVPSPPLNWLSPGDLGNLFELAGLESVRRENRLLVPLPIPGAGLVNRYVAPMPLAGKATIYQLYVLRASGGTAVRARPSVTVVVPARNEAGNIDDIVRRTPSMGGGTELIFVEGGSKDDTWARIQEAVRTYEGPLRLRALRQSGKGKGDAVRLGFEEATGDILMILDADLSVAPEELPRFVDVLEKGQADYVHGTRLVYPMEHEAMRTLNRIGNVFFSRAFSFLLDQPIRDTLCGTKVLWAKDYQRLAAARSFFGDFDPFGDFDLIFGAARLQLRIMEIPVRYRARVYGATNIDRWRHGLLLLRMTGVAARKLKFIG